MYSHLTSCLCIRIEPLGMYSSTVNELIVNLVDVAEISSPNVTSNELPVIAFIKSTTSPFLAVVNPGAKISNRVIGPLTTGSDMIARHSLNR